MVIKDFIPPILLRARTALIRKVTGLRYNASGNDYNAEKYWDERHRKYGFDTLRGVGVSGHSEDENFAWYESARYIFLGMLSELNISKTDGKILELGYGTGFYPNILEREGYKNYTGLDIANVHISKLEARNPTFAGKFHQVNVGEQYFECKDCDLIIMIDVSQHIVNDDKMTFCLQQNVKRNLKPNGVFLTTDELGNTKYSFYEVSRSIEFYQKALGMQLLHKPVFFRGKYIFSFINKPL